MSELFAAVVSITATRRRRFLWAAWWIEPPTRAPFRKPDAYNGGARSHQEAVREAEQRAGRALVEMEGSWARAWARVLLGKSAFVEDAKKEDGETSTQRPESQRTERSAKGQLSIWQTLGLESGATVEEIKRAFRKHALATHPDHGGDSDAFRRVRSAYVEALNRRGVATARSPKRR